ncbi:MAG: IS256 family transposase [Proteobacteria bacterium]|nr:IS256 family transposase [Pseudomonadota bacterium]
MQDDSVIKFEKRLEDPLTELIRSGAQQLLERAVQAELAELLERFSDRRTEDGRAGVVRNGFQPEREILTGVGPVSVKIPKVRSRLTDPVVFQSTLVPPYVRRSRALEAAIPWLYLKGVSTGDMQSALEVLVGKDAQGLSPNVVSRLKRQWQQEYEAWGKQRLDEDRWVYMWADGIYSRLRGDADKLCVLVVVGVNERGEKHFLAIEDGVRESKQSWREVLLGLKGRGLTTAPKLAAGDGALGFWAALAEVYPTTTEQRCWMHKTGNVLNYLPKASQPKAKKALQAIWMAETRQSANVAFDEFVGIYEAKYPKAVECLVKDRMRLLAFYDFPAEHWVHLRTTNPIESSFATIRHRTDRAKGCVTRDTMLAMIFKLGQCAEKNWRRIRGFKHVAKVIQGVRFVNGIEQEVSQSKAAA